MTDDARREVMLLVGADPLAAARRLVGDWVAHDPETGATSDDILRALTPQSEGGEAIELPMIDAGREIVRLLRLAKNENDALRGALRELAEAVAAAVRTADAIGVARTEGLRAALPKAQEALRDG